MLDNDDIDTDGCRWWHL